MSGLFGSGVKEKDEVIIADEVGIHVVPIGSGVIHQVVGLRYTVEPGIGFVYKADMGCVMFCGEESDDPRRCGGRFSDGMTGLNEKYRNNNGANAAGGG